MLHQSGHMCLQPFCDSTFTGVFAIGSPVCCFESAKLAVILCIMFTVLYQVELGYEMLKRL
jgi:hypothetical protein